MIKYILFFILLLSVSFTTLNAKIQDLLTSISDDMEHFNQVATTTKNNVLYQPYVISIFEGKDLEKLGILNLEEALSLVPGIDMATDNIGIKTPIFRGSNPMAYGQSKLFIDGVLANNVFFDAYSEHLKMPVEMIKRIEVVRGPGSKTDGYNAYAGSINVITYAENIEDFKSINKIIAKGGSYDYAMAGFVKNYKLDDFILTTDFTYQQDDKTAYAGPDGMSQGVLSAPGYDNTALSKDGDAYLWFKNYALGVTLNYKDIFYAKLRLVEHIQSSGYGINITLAANKSDRLKLPSYSLELGYKEKISNLDITVKGAVKYDAFDSMSQLVHPDFTFFDLFTKNTDPSAFVYTDAVVFPDGTFGIHQAEQITYTQSTFFKYNGFNNHEINFGYRLTQEKTIDMTSKLSDWTTGIYTPTDYTETFAFFEDNVKRNTQAYFLEDSYYFSSTLSFLFGLNYERTSFSSTNIEPRFSLVYQIDRQNIYKFIYSKSHRNPSWQEMFTKNNHSRQGSTDFKPELVEAYEISYIHKLSSSNHIQTNIFYLENSDQIQQTGTAGIFANIGDSTIYGGEFEYKGNILSKDILYINYSFIDGKVNNINILPNVAAHMIKGYYSYNITNKISMSTIFKYISKKERLESDSRNSLKGYSKIDLTLRYENQRYNYILIAGIKNIFDSDIRFPSKDNTYYQDYIQEGRSFMVTLKKEF